MLAATGALALVACSGTAPESAGAAGTVTPPPAVQVAAPTTSPEPLPAVSAQPRAAAPAGADPSSELHAELLRAIGNAACSNDAHCRVLPLGSKPCGGPEGYLAWSTSTANAPQVEALALRYREARQARNERLGIASNCMVLPEPEVRCVPAGGAGAAGGSGTSGGQCRTLPGRGGPTLLTR